MSPEMEKKRVFFFVFVIKEDIHAFLHATAKNS
jgi:hypothetical protein